MRYYLLFFLLLHLHQDRPVSSFFNDECIQINNIFSGNTPDSLVYTPAGLALKSNIHYVDSKHHINIYDNDIKIIETKSGLISKEFKRFNSKVEKKSKEVSWQDLKSRSSKSISEFNDGWTTYATCKISISYPGALDFFSTDYIVPAQPLNKSNQLIYIFSGIGTIEQGVASILQPVLQWGKSPAGGGDYWSVCNWFVTSNQFFYDSLVKVDPGTRLQGLIKLQSIADTLYNYTSSFTNLTSEFQINNVPHLHTFYEVLETFNLNNCNEYPPQEKIIMSNIKIKTGNINPPTYWYTMNEVVGCGQLTKIVDSSSFDGQVDIYFRTPSTGDYFDVLHVYPNPVNNILSIKSLKQISNCKIEIYSFSGSLLQTISNIDINFDYGSISSYYYEVNMQNYMTGIYLLKVSYENKSHTFKIIKK
jgi:Secretion system C-terminal sorting domain